MNAVSQRSMSHRIQGSSLTFLYTLLALAVPAGANLASERPATSSLKSRVDAVFAAWNRPDSPGCALGVVQNGKLVFQQGYGRANLEHDIPITSSTVFYIASASKQFTAASILLLARQGKLSLDDGIQKYLPELPPYDSPVTIRHLMHHTSGINDYFELFTLSGQRLDDVHSEEEILEMLARQKSLGFKPGEYFLYSNSGYFLLGVIVRRASGKSLAQFAEEQIFKPLGMSHSLFHDSRTRLVKNRAHGYFSGKDGEFRNYLTQFDGVGDGGLMTTVEDLFRWNQALEQGTLAGKDFAATLLAPGRLNNGQTLNYASGLMSNSFRGLQTVSHGGSFIGFRSELLRFPEKRLSVICLCNHNAIDATRLAKDVAALFLDQEIIESSREVSAVESVPQLPLSETGVTEGNIVFREPATGSIWRFSTADGKLTASVDGESFRLTPTGSHRFRSLDAPLELDLEFQMQSPNQPFGLQVKVEGQTPVKLDAVKVMLLSAEQLAEFAGNYYSSELQTVYQLFVHEEKLFLRVKNRSDSEAVPVLPDLFRVEGKNLSFSRNAEGRITGFVLSSGRIHNLRFTKERGN